MSATVRFSLKPLINFIFRSKEDVYFNMINYIDYISGYGSMVPNNFFLNVINYHGHDSTRKEMILNFKESFYKRSNW